MIITLSPQYRDACLSVSKAGDCLTLNSETHDFSTLPEGGAVVVSSDWIVGPVRRLEGQLHLTLVLPHGEDAPTETLFPAPIHLATDGPVILPPPRSPALPEDTALAEG